MATLLFYNTPSRTLDTTKPDRKLVEIPQTVRGDLINSGFFMLSMVSEGNRDVIELDEHLSNVLYSFDQVEDDSARVELMKAAREYSHISW